MDTAAVARAFVDAINRHDVDILGDLMTENHVFVDSLGARIEGRAAMLGGWRGYFSIFPDYQLTVDGLLAAGDTALLHGRAGATLHRDGQPAEFGAWEIPAAWRAVVSRGRVALWQVYADNKPVYALLGL